LAQTVKNSSTESRRGW